MRSPFRGFDAYTLKARVAPALLALTPVFIAAFIWLPTPGRWIGVAFTAAANLGAAYLLAEFGRAGKRQEESLYAAWGGKPTTILLRRRGNTNPELMRRRHNQITRLLGIRLPTEADEFRDPPAAERMYDLATSVLRARTRSKSRFPLVSAELQSYGFRRNLWGLKRTGLACCAMGAVAAGVRLYLAPSTLHGVAFSLIIAAACLWVLFRSDWVRVPAFAYAEQLLAALEILGARRAISDEKRKTRRRPRS